MRHRTALLTLIVPSFLFLRLRYLARASVRPGFVPMVGSPCSLKSNTGNNL